MEQAGEMAGGRARGDHIIKQRHVLIGVGPDLEGAAQIAPPLAGTEPGLLRGCPDPAQQAVVTRNAGQLTEGDGYLFRLIEAAPPLAPPVQRHWNDGLWRIAEIQMVCQQPGEQRGQQDLAGILQPGDQHGVGWPVVTDDLQPLPGRRPALAAAADRLAFFMQCRQGSCTQAAGVVSLLQCLPAPAAQQGVNIARLLAEQTVALPVGMAAEDRTCFGEQPL